VKVLKLADSRAELVLPDNQVVTVSLKYLPDDMAVGHSLYLSFLDEGDLNKAKSEIAQEVLHEILRS
jgi:hypothetical protein